MSRRSTNIVDKEVNTGHNTLTVEVRDMTVDNRMQVIRIRKYDMADIASTADCILRANSENQRQGPTAGATELCVPWPLLR